MFIKAWFTKFGVPETGLIPILWVYDLTDGTVDINDQDMTEIDKGWYYYTFDDFDQNHVYVYMIDGTSHTEPPERYQFGELKYFTET